MADVVCSEVRSKMMGGIRSRHTRPELKVRRALHSRRLRFRLTNKELPCRPDIILSRFRAVVFVHGCFWHRHSGCRFTTTPKSNEDFWQAKFRRNVERDHECARLLELAGWRHATIWECSTRSNDFEASIELLVAWLESNDPSIEL
jgi:DNA mismatch endonuclease (patch repair protein)